MELLYLHVSNKTEHLLLHLTEVMRSAGRRSPFEKEFFLIQSQGMERVISQTMADNFTSWCHFEFMLPVQFLNFCAERLGVEQDHSAYERDVMLWRIEELLRDVAGDIYTPVRSYVSGKDGPLKRFQLAAQLSNLFDQYQLMRPEMIAAWQEGRTLTGENSEAWQMDLWRRLGQGQKDCRNRGDLLAEVVRRLRDGGADPQGLPPRINVFGLSTMVPLFLRFLQAVSVHAQVHLYVLSPCRHYWGDTAGRRSNPEAAESHPLLVSLGQQGRDFQKLLFDDIEYEQDFSSYEDPAQGDDPKLLAQLQSGLLQGGVELWSGEENVPADDSIRIVSCHSRIRELAVLKDHILEWLYNKPELQLRDIVVMAPDIQEYSALIPALFSDIQHSIADRSLRRRNDVVSAFSSFLSMFTGRFGWDEVLELLKEPVVAGRLQLSETDLENIREWVVACGIRWGLSGTWKEKAGLAVFEESTWRAGLERMLMGYTIDSEEFVDEVLPFGEVEGGGAALLGSLCHFVSLIERATVDFETRLDLAGWSRLLQDYCEQLFEDGSRDYLDLQEILSSLDEISREYHHGEVEFRVVREWMERVTREVRSSSGFLRGQLTFCSMLPMRSIPFRHVCLLGMNEGEFPRNDQMATFDLMSRSYRPGDRSRRMDDRYQFLEAILSAREGLYISYIGQSVRTNEPVPPAVVVSELLDVLSGCYGVDSIVVEHPLQPYSMKYYDGSHPSLFSYHDGSCQVAANLRRSVEPQPPWWRGQRNVEIDEIDWSGFLGFFRHPQQWFLRNSLGVRIRDEIAVVEESEPFSHDGLETFLVDQHILDKMACGATEKSLLKELQTAGRWPLGRAGELQFTERFRQLTEFETAMDALQPGAKRQDIPIDLTVGGIRLYGMLGNVYEEGIFISRHAGLKAADYLGGWLHFLVYRRVTGKELPAIVVGKELQAVRLGLGRTHGPDLEQMVRLFVEGGTEPSRLYPEYGFAGLEQQSKGNDLKAGARSAFVKAVNNDREPELRFLLDGSDFTEIFDAEFERLCHEILEPLWRAGQ